MFNRIATGVLAMAIVGSGGAAFAQQGIVPEAPKPTKADEKRVLEAGKWYPKLEGGLNLTQASYSTNWKGGEEGSVSWSAYLNGTAENQINTSLNWLTTMELLYGQTRRQELDGSGDRHWGDSEKSADLIQIESILRVTRGWWVDPYFSFRFESFFQDVTDPFGRTLWINPMTFKESVGIAKKFLDYKDHQLLVRFGVGAREGYRRFFTAPVGDETFSVTSWDTGSEAVIDYMKIFDERLTYTSRLSIYQPFTWSANDTFDEVGADSLMAYGISPDITDYATTADVDWQNTLTTKVTKFISFNFFLEILYDKYDNTVAPVADGGVLTNPEAVRQSVRKKGQFKQTFGVGVTYAFK